jgi:thioredoxin-related protein
MFGAHCLGNELWGRCFFEDTITAENYPDLLTQFIVLLEENERGCSFQQDRATTHNTKTRALCRTSSVIAMPGIVFGHHNHQTLRHLPSFCAHLFKKESTA